MKASPSDIDWTKKEQLLAGLEQDFRDIKRERARLSNMYPGMVRDQAGPETLAAHYQEIESYTDQLKVIWMKKKHVTEHGDLPLDKASQAIESTVDNLPALREKRRRLVDKRCKLKGKIAKAIRPESAKVLEWKLAMDQADVEYNEIDQMIKRLQSNNNE